MTDLLIRIKLFFLFQMMAFASAWKPKHGLTMINHAALGAETESWNETMAAARGLGSTAKPEEPEND